MVLRETTDNQIITHFEPAIYEPASMNSKKKLIRLCALGVGGVALLLILCVVLLLLADGIFGGPHEVMEGKSHGFRIGMTKAEVFDTYRKLNETANISGYAVNGNPGFFALEASPADLKFSSEFEFANHWKAYRRKWPIWFQEFHFSDGKLTNIMTYIRFIETP